MVYKSKRQVKASLGAVVECDPGPALVVTCMQADMMEGT